MGKVTGRDTKIFSSKGTAKTILDITLSPTSGNVIVEVTSHGYTAGDFVYLESVSMDGEEFNGYRKVESVVDANNFEVKSRTDGLAYTGDGESSLMTIEHAFETSFDNSIDELEATEFGGDDWREFISGLKGGNMSYSYYKRTTEKDIDDLGTTKTIYLVVGEIYELIFSVVITSVNITTATEDISKVSVGARITGTLQEDSIT